MTIRYEKTQTLISMARGYLRIKIKTPYGIKTATKKCSAQKEDLNLIFWGEESVKAAQKKIGMSGREKRLVAEGDTLGKYISRNVIHEWILEKKNIRKQREESIQQTELVLRALHKLFLKERRQEKAIGSRVRSGIIPFMDGSALLWLSVILAAKKDFLKGHDDPRRIDEWDMLDPCDLLDVSGGVKRGSEDAWAYVTARDFLFNDDYHIDLGNPDEGIDKSVNCETLLDNLIETHSSRESAATFIDPSMSHLRSSLSKKSGDPRLIALYVKK